MDSPNRVAAFAYGNHYFLAYANGENGTNNPYAAPDVPTVCYGGFVVGKATPPAAIAFSNPTALTIPGVPSDRNFTHMAAAVFHDTPYLFQFKCSSTGNPTLLGAYYDQLELNSPTNPNPHFPGANGSAPGTLTVGTAPVNSVGSLFDVASAALGNKAYVFLLAGPGAYPSNIQVWSYDGNASTGPVQETNYTFGNAGSPEVAPFLKSIDATDVMLPSGEQAIVVTAVYNDDLGTSRVLAWLFPGNASSPVTLPVAILGVPPSAQTSASARVIYGPAIGSSPINSCTVFYAATNAGNSGVSGNIYSSQIALPATLSSGTLSQVGGWAANPNPWLNNRNANFTQFPYAWAGFAASVPFGASTKGFRSVGQYVSLFQKGSAADSHTHHDLLVSDLALQLKLNTSTAGKTWDSSTAVSMDEADAEAAVQSWNLLGVITGLPPLPVGTTVTYQAPILSLKYESEATQSQQTNHTTVVSAGGGISLPFLNTSTSYTNSGKVGSSSSNTIRLSLTQAFHSSGKNNDYSVDSQLGFLIVSEPLFSTGQYTVYAWDGTTPIGISTETIATNSSKIVPVPFYLDNPAAPYPGEPACIYNSFPADNGVATVTYPLMTDIAGWEMPDTLTNVVPIVPNFSEPIGIAGSQFSSYTVQLFTSHSNTSTSGTSNKINIGGGVTFLGLGANGNCSVEIDSQTSTTFSTGTTTQIAYPQLNPSSTSTMTPVYSSIGLNAYIERLGSDPDAAANWMPTIFQGSQPWLITWQVASTGTASPGSAGRGNWNGAKPSPGTGKGW